MGGNISVEQQMKRDIRLISRQERKLDREIDRMTFENKKNISNIKRYAEAGNIEMVNALSREYIIYKNNIVKLSKMKGKMSNIRQKSLLMKSNHEINISIISLTHTMKSMNATMGLPRIQRMITDFEQELTKTETMNDVMETMMEDDIDEEDTAALVDGVLDEIGMDMAQSLSKAPTKSVTDIERELDDRFKRLLE